MLAKATPNSKAGRKLPRTRHLSQKAFHRGLSTSPRKTMDTPRMIRANRMSIRGE